MFNIATRRKAKNVETLSPWFQTHGEEFPGKHFVFGQKVIYEPPNTKLVKKQQPKMGPTARIGIFAGYELNPGYTWGKSYRVWDLKDFAGNGFSR